MTTAFELLKNGRSDEIWKKYIGFTDLSLEEFMDIQRRLLLEQINLLSQCTLGRHLFSDKTLKTVDDFRTKIPLTTYKDYNKYLDEQNEDILPVKPKWWLRTSGRTSGPGAFKWAPYTPLMAKKMGEAVLALFIMASSTKVGKFPFKVGDRMLFTLAPFPYMSGGISRAILEEFPFQFLPPLEEAEEMEFQERIQEGLLQALIGGMDAINAIAIVLMRIGEQFTQGTGNMNMRSLLTNPSAVIRLLKGLIRSRMAGRKQLLPKDIWKLNGIGTGGTDTIVFREKIKELWGKAPIEAYGCTESGVMSLQLWEGPGMTFLPDICFIELVPYEEFLKNHKDLEYEPKTVLLDEVKVDEIYELVITNFHGGAFVRYRTGDLVKFIALENNKLGVQLPQMVFHAKSSDIIDLSSISRLTEKVIWQAIEEAGITYNDWTARKEYIQDKPMVALYIELNGCNLEASEIKNRVYDKLSVIDPSFAELQDVFGINPLHVTILPSGAFNRFYQFRVDAGADMAHLKPSHINASDNDLVQLKGMES
ncbi:MAG: GH3 auxin-responsive promoter family protein [Anaerolineales bacterium]|nr:GH3 auxin-responsive promoter family protein [Anaerolineales bacterium]